MLARSSRIGDPHGMAAGVADAALGSESVPLVVARWVPLSHGTQAYPDGQRDLHRQTDDRITFWTPP